MVGFVIGAVNTAAGSAAQIVLTQIVPRERLVEAHAKNSLASSTAEVSGPGAAGALIKLTGAPVALLADALLLLISATILRGVRVRETSQRPQPPFWPAMREGLQLRPRQPLLVTMATCVGIWQLCSQAAVVVQILFATRQLGLSATRRRLCYVALGAGTDRSPAPLSIASAVALDPVRCSSWALAVWASAGCCSPFAPVNALGVAAFALMLLHVRRRRSVHVHQLPGVAAVGDARAACSGA